MKDISLKIDDEYLPLRDVVFNTLRNAILMGDIEPGERLMEVKLAEKLGVSRTPIREAIRMLELEGLVEMAPRKGAQVAKITKEDIKDVLEVRKVLEDLAIDLACDNIDAQEIKKLEENVVRFQNAIKKNDIKEIAVIDVEFHEIIYVSTKNRRLIQILSNLREQMYRYRFEYIKDKETREVLVKEHKTIVEALKNKNKQGGKDAIKKHLDRQENTILKNL